jgi:hypothetical protein
LATVSIPVAGHVIGKCYSAVSTGVCVGVFEEALSFFKSFPFWYFKHKELRNKLGIIGIN